MAENGHSEKSPQPSPDAPKRQIGVLCWHDCDEIKVRIVPKSAIIPQNSPKTLKARKIIVSDENSIEVQNLSPETEDLSAKVHFSPQKVQKTPKNSPKLAKTTEFPTTAPRRRRARRIFSRCLLVIFVAVFLYSGAQIVFWWVDSNNISAEADQTVELADVQEITDNDATEIIENDVAASDPYWDFIKMSLINVDFSKLIIVNPDTVAWLQLGGTNINYPVVQAADNDYYLTHSFYKNANSAGWVFMDYRNSPDGTDKNTLIYAHGRLNGTMFGSLKNILTSGWLNNTSNFVVKLSTATENTLWQVFSVYHIPTTNDYLKIKFSTKTAYLDFLNMLLNRSAYDFQTSITADDQILTLSTCYGLDSSERVVLHAKLIKRAAR